MPDRTLTTAGDRRTRVAVAIAAVLATTFLAVAAAPVFSQEQPEGGSMDLIVGGGNMSGDLNNPGLPFEWVFVLLFGLGVVSIVVQIVANPWRSLKLALGLAIVLGAGYVVVRYIYEFLKTGQSSREPMPPGNTTDTPGTPANRSGPGETASTDVAWPIEEIGLIVLALGLVVVLAALLWRREALASVLGDEDDGTETGDLGAVGRAAGDAADRIENATTARSADDAIYRTWREMLDLLGASDPQSATPRTFAAAAVESGMDPEDVQVLTRAFEEVRYGHADLSEHRREQASAALRRIESNHTTRGADDAESTSADPSTDGSGGSE